MKKNITNQSDVDLMARTMIQGLREHANPERARGVQQYFKNEIVALGIDAPTVRQFVRDQVESLIKSWTIQEAIDLCDRLLQEEELEIRGTGILALSAFKKQFAPQLTEPAQRWLRNRLDNWALVDSFCGCVLSPLLERHPAIEISLRKWSGDRCLWVRRASLVTLVPFARRGKHLDLAYLLAQEHFPDVEDLMHKATGWLLREAGKTEPKRLRGFLLEHGPDIPRTALRYAIEKFAAPERARGC